MDIRLHMDIDATPDRVWGILGERFMHVGEWAAPISRSCGVNQKHPGLGSVRECHTVGIGPIPPGRVRERLTAFDPAARSLAYEAATGLPSFILSAVSRWSVEPLGAARSCVRMHASFSLRWFARIASPLMRWQMTREGGRVLEDLKYFSEHGHPHPRKRRAAADPVGMLETE